MRGEKSSVQALDRAQASLPMVQGARRDDDPRLPAARGTTAAFRPFAAGT